MRLAGALLLATPTGTKAASGGLQLSYFAPASCPTRGEFTSALSVRVSRLALTDDTLNRMLSLSVVESEAGYRGVLRLFVGGTPAFQRVLVDQYCDALIEALALVAAMELRPPSQSYSSPKAPSKVADAELNSPGQLVTDDDARRFEFRIAAVVGLDTAPTPAPLVTIGVNGALTTHGGPGHWSISVLYGQTGYGQYSNGEARFRWLSTRFNTCPFGFSQGNFGIFPCALGEFGLFRGEGRQVADAAGRSSVWLAPGLGLLGLIGIREFSIEGLVGVVRPIVRDRFLFAGATASDRDEDVHRADAFGLVSELRFGRKF